MDEAFLYVSSEVQVQMQVGHGGLEVVMTQAVFDIGGRVTPCEHIHGTGMAEAVHGIDCSETFGRQGGGEVFSAESIDAVAGEFLPTLIDKEALLKGRFWGRTESRDVELEELSGSGLQFDEAEAVALSQDSEGFLLRVEVVEVESGDFTGPGP